MDSDFHIRYSFYDDFVSVVTDREIIRQEDVIAIGWNEIGDLSRIAPDRDAFKKNSLRHIPIIRK